MTADCYTAMPVGHNRVLPVFYQQYGFFWWISVRAVVIVMQCTCFALNVLSIMYYVKIDVELEAYHYDAIIFISIPTVLRYAILRVARNWPGSIYSHGSCFCLASSEHKLTLLCHRLFPSLIVVSIIILLSILNVVSYYKYCAWQWWFFKLSN